MDTKNCCGHVLEWEIVSLQCHTFKVMEARCTECRKRYTKRSDSKVVFWSKEGKTICMECKSEAKLAELLHDVSVGKKKRTVTEFVPHCPCCEKTPLKLA